MKTSTIVSSALVLAVAATQGVYSMPVVQTPAIDTRSTLSDMDMSQYFKTSLEQDLQRGGSAGRGRGGGGRGGSARGGYSGRVVEIQFGKREEVARRGDSGAVRGGASVRGGTSDRGGSTCGGGRGGGLGRPDSDKLQNIIATIKGAIRGAISDRGSTRGGTSSRGRGRGTSRPVEDVLDEQKHDTESGLVERSSDSQSTPSDFTKRYVQGFVAPSGYNYSWVIDGYRLALDASGIKSYITRSTISKDASSTTQTHVNQCVGFTEKRGKVYDQHVERRRDSVGQLYLQQECWAGEGSHYHNNDESVDVDDERSFHQPNHRLRILFHRNNCFRDIFHNKQLHYGLLQYKQHFRALHDRHR
ncbi:hypothetical protein NDA16_002933 [Ustilago loliicola]|nr:hypothetical protein NDA16_002933 [Ustilago loliicola]